MTEASAYLRSLARRIADVYAALPQTRAIMLTGSAAEGHSDFFSDVDMTVYYEMLPSEDELVAARSACGGGDRIWQIGDRDGGSFAEAFPLDGIECQIGQITVAAWERDMATVREAQDVTTPLQKAMSGTLTCLPLVGAPLIEGWKAQIADFLPLLAQAMVEKYLAVFPVWSMPERFLARDAGLWLHQLLVETEQNLLGVLAGVNRLYYTTFQFKRQDDFIAQMTIAPPDLSPRLTQLLRAEPATAIEDLKTLVRETVEIVEAHLPAVDTSRVRRQLDYRIPAWTLPAQGG